MQTREQVFDHYTEILRSVVEKLPWASVAWAAVWVFDWLMAWPSVAAIVSQSVMFSTVTIAVLLDTYFGIRSAKRQGNDITFGRAFWGVSRKTFEYFIFLILAIEVALAVKGQSILGDVAAFVRGVVFMAICFVEAESAAGHAGLQIQRVFRFAIEAASKRFPMPGNGELRKYEEDEGSHRENRPR